MTMPTFSFFIFFLVSVFGLIGPLNRCNALCALAIQKQDLNYSLLTSARNPPGSAHGLFTPLILSKYLHFPRGGGGGGGDRDGTVVRALASHQCDADSRHFWVEFVGGSRPLSQVFFYRFSGFLSLIRNTSFWVNSWRSTREGIGREHLARIPASLVLLAHALLKNLSHLPLNH